MVSADSQLRHKAFLFAAEDACIGDFIAGPLVTGVLSVASAALHPCFLSRDCRGLGLDRLRVHVLVMILAQHFATDLHHDSQLDQTVHVVIVHHYLVLLHLLVS